MLRGSSTHENLDVGARYEVGTHEKCDNKLEKIEKNFLDNFGSELDKK